MESIRQCYVDEQKDVKLEEISYFQNRQNIQSKDFHTPPFFFFLMKKTNNKQITLSMNLSVWFLFCSPLPRQLSEAI